MTDNKFPYCKCQWVSRVAAITSVWKLNSTQLWEAPDGIINTNAGTVCCWCACEKLKVWCCLCTEACQWYTGIKTAPYTCLFPSIPPKGFQGIFLKIILYWIYTEWAKGNSFSRTSDWFLCLRHPESHRSHPIGGSPMSSRPAPFLGLPSMARPFS